MSITPAPQVEIQLPELPLKTCLYVGATDAIFGYTADQMRAYAQAALNARAGGDGYSELVDAANEMMRQDAVQRATELTNPFMAGAADKLASALRKVGAR